MPTVSRIALVPRKFSNRAAYPKTLEIIGMKSSARGRQLLLVRDKLGLRAEGGLQGPRQIAGEFWTPWQSYVLAADADPDSAGAEELALV